MISAMQEVLTKTIDSTVPLKNQEFYELSLLDEPNDLGLRHYVRQTRFAWNEASGDVLPDPEEVEYFWILDEATARYERRRQVLAVRGFIYSDMDLF